MPQRGSSETSPMAPYSREASGSASIGEIFVDSGTAHLAAAVLPPGGWGPHVRDVPDLVDRVDGRARELVHPLALEEVAGPPPLGQRGRPRPRRVVDVRPRRHRPARVEYLDRIAVLDAAWRGIV